MKKVWGIFGVVGLLLIAALLDTLYRKAQRAGQVSLPSTDWTLWGMRAFSLVLLAVLLLALAWYLLYYEDTGRLVFIGCILLGTFTLLTVSVAGVQLFWTYFVPLRPIITEIASSPLSLTGHAAAFILCVGVIGLLWPKKQYE